MTLPNCKEWHRARTSYGYGNIWNGGKVVYVHRLEWEKHNGSIPKGMCVLHRCDNPPCYNIDHLFLGTRRDNMIDKTLKKRGKNPNQRLTNLDAITIRSRFKNGESRVKLSLAFKCGRDNIEAIINRRSFKSV